LSVRDASLRPIAARLLVGDELYAEIVRDKLARARESVWIATANLKAMMIEQDGEFVPVLELFARLAERGVELRLLHAELPSRPFRREFDRRAALGRGGLALKLCPRTHFKAVLVDGAWIYLGSANLTGAGLGAKHAARRNFEVGFVTEDFDVIDRIRALFESIWSGAECGPCRVRELCPDPIGAATTPARPARRQRRRRRSIVGSWKSRPKRRG
jgi:phosphatidylserine/phosphatidylglycerophosphate/cardiolipin synthase-like enzyme